MDTVMGCRRQELAARSGLSQPPINRMRREAAEAWQCFQSGVTS